MKSFWLAQLIGFIALGLFILVFQVNKRHTMLKLSMWAAFTYAIHYFLLGAYTGAALSLVTAIRNYTYSKYGMTKHRLILPVVFIIIFSVAAMLTWQGPLSFLPLCASIAGAIAYWQKSPRIIRLVELLSTPLLLFYNVASHSYPGVIIEMLFLAATTIGIYRFDIRLVNQKQRVLAK